MGHATSFPEMTTSGETMDTYIQKRNLGIIADLQTTRDEFNNFITEAFPAGGKLNIVAGNEVFDWRQSDENNLDVIAKAIAAVLGSVTEALAGYDLLPAPVMTGIATTCITNVMGLFTTRTEGRFSSAIQEVPLAPGLRLFAVSVSIDLEDKQIFNNATMVVSWILYKVIFSNDLFKTEMKTAILEEISSDLKDDLGTIHDANTHIKLLSESLLSMDPDDSQYAKTERIIANNTKILKAQTALVMDLQEEVDDTKTVLLSM